MPWIVLVGELCYGPFASITDAFNWARTAYPEESEKGYVRVRQMMKPFQKELLDNHV